MGSSTAHICRVCGSRFGVRSGGGFFFDLLHCETCGRTRTVSQEALGDIHLRYVKGLPGPYAIARSAFDHRIQLEYPGEPLTREEYRAAAEATLDPCTCGGRFGYDAPARCPTCRSTSDAWDPDLARGTVLYD